MALFLTQLHVGSALDSHFLSQWRKIYPTTNKMRTTIRYYIIDDNGRPIPEPDLLKWAAWFETYDRSVAHDVIEGVRISTVFLGLDHGWLSNDEGAAPILWETMIFGGEHDLYQ